MKLREFRAFGCVAISFCFHQCYNDRILFKLDPRLCPAECYKIPTLSVRSRTRYRLPSTINNTRKRIKNACPYNYSTPWILTPIVISCNCSNRHENNSENDPTMNFFLPTWAYDNKFAHTSTNARRNIRMVMILRNCHLRGSTILQIKTATN